MENIEEVKTAIDKLEQILNELEAKILMLESHKHRDLYKDEINTMKETVEVYRAQLNE